MLILLSAGSVFCAARAFIIPNILSPADSSHYLACARISPNIKFPLPANKRGYFL